MPQYVYKTCLVLLVIFLSTYSIELSFLTSIIVLALTFSSKLNGKVGMSAFLLLTLMSIGLISSVQFKYPFFDTLKDIIYFLRPITILLSSYFVVKRIHSSTYVFDVIVFIALFFAIKHLLNIIININSIDSYVYLRSLGGKQNHLETLALIVLFFTPFHNTYKKYKKLIKIIILFSFILYLSRTMFITLFIFFLGYKGYLFLNKRLIKGIFVFTIFSLFLGVIITNVETNRDSTGIKAFIYKTQNSFVELFEPVDTEYILSDKRSLWEYWRAYEAQKAIAQLNDNGVKAWLLGMGFGPPIKLGIEVDLDGKKFTEVPTIHNGFIYVLFKTGLIGLLFYILFILYNFISFQKFRSYQSNTIFNKLLVATSIYIFLNSFVITGIFRPGEFSIFLLGILIASKYKMEKNYIIENEN